MNLHSNQQVATPHTSPFPSTHHSDISLTQRQHVSCWYA